MIRKPLAGSLAVCARVLSRAQGQAVARQKPFKIDGGGTAPDRIPLPGNSAPHWAVGNANRPGKYYAKARSKRSQQPRAFLRALLARFGPTTPKQFGAKHETCPHVAGHVWPLVHSVLPGRGGGSEAVPPILAAADSQTPMSNSRWSLQNKDSSVIRSS